MGKPTGFMEDPRQENSALPPLERIRNFDAFCGALSEKNRRRQAGRCMDCGVPFCQAGIRFDGQLLGCPLHNLIPEWNDLLWLGSPESALSRLIKTSSFPEFTGRVCPAPCEKACTCGRIAEPVTIRENELAIAEYGFENGLMAPRIPAVRTGMRAAVVGSGPAGLAAAQDLNGRGHTVTVFERDPEPGGLLRYGIPNMKLPKEIVRRRIALMEAEGVVFRTGTEAQEETLVRDYDCVLLCCGARRPRPLAFEGDGCGGVAYALDYLRAADGAPVPEGAEALSAAGRRVAVVGAGDSAGDCVATALRQGCRSIVQLIRKPRCRYPEGTDCAHEEAEALFGGDIRRFETQVKAARPDAAGRLAALTLVSPDGESETEADLLLVASGFSGPDAGAQRLAEALADRPGVFTAGDMAGGASLVVLAIADGRRAAAAAHAWLLQKADLD